MDLQDIVVLDIYLGVSRRWKLEKGRGMMQMSKFASYCITSIDDHRNAYESESSPCWQGVLGVGTAVEDGGVKVEKTICQTSRRDVGVARRREKEG